MVSQCFGFTVYWVNYDNLETLQPMLAGGSNLQFYLFIHNYTTYLCFFFVNFIYSSKCNVFLDF